MLKISNIKYNLTNETKNPTLATLLEYGVKQIQKKIKINKVEDIKLLKKSLDARTKEELSYVLTYSFKAENENRLLKKYPILSTFQDPIDFSYLKSYEKIEERCLVVGMGPSGLFCAYLLALSGRKVILIDRGKKVEDREKDVQKFFSTGILNEESNIQFGEGGAGTFSDGKLSTNVNSPYISFILNTFVKFGADPSILYESHPHVGTDILRKVLINFRNELIRLGVEIYYETKLIDFSTSVATAISYEKKIHFSFDKLILAVGHSAEDIYQLLKDKQFKMEPKPFAVGVRIEQKQKIINSAQYKGDYPFLPPANYKLVTHLENGRSLYTFCMCPGGTVVNASSKNGHTVCNGMSNFAREKENANSALLVNVLVEDYYKGDIFDGVTFLRSIEKKAYDKTHTRLPVQRVDDFYQNRVTTSLGKVSPSASTGFAFSNLREILPSFVSETITLGLPKLNNIIKDFSTDDAILTGVETRSSAPIRICRVESLETSMKNVYAVGEGAGFAGGITSSSIDGIKIALRIIERIHYE